MTINRFFEKSNFKKKKILGKSGKIMPLACFVILFEIQFANFFYVYAFFKVEFF